MNQPKLACLGLGNITDELIHLHRKTMRKYLDFRDKASFTIDEDERYYEIDIADYANQMAGKILDW